MRNRLDDVIAIWKLLGSPALTSTAAAEKFIRTVAAVFEFGWPEHGFRAIIDVIPRAWGVRRSDAGTISDTLRFGDEAVDIMLGHGSDRFSLPRDFRWLTPVGLLNFEPARRQDLPSSEVRPPPPETSMPNKLISPDGRTNAQIQNDGNFVIHKDDVPIWSSKTSHLPPSQPEPPPPDPRPIPTPTPAPTGRIRGDFLYPYFGPAYMSYVRAKERFRQFDVQRAIGATDILVMAQWVVRDPFWSKGWAGPAGFDFSIGSADMELFQQTLLAIELRGMRATVVAHDRGASSSYDEIMLVDLVRKLYDEAGDQIDAIMPVFELDEIANEEEQISLFAKLSEITQGTVGLVAHHASVQTDKQFWRRMQAAGCTDFFAQYARPASLHRLSENTKRWIGMLPPDIAYCCFEHSAEEHYSNYNPVQRDERWEVCAIAMKAAGRPLHSFNSTLEV